MADYIEMYVTRNDKTFMFTCQAKNLYINIDDGGVEYMYLLDGSLISNIPSTNCKVILEFETIPDDNGYNYTLNDLPS